MKFLHIAPEICFIKPFEELKNLDYITADLESPLAKIKMDIHDMPFDDNTMDAVMCNHVLEHVEDDKLAMGEILRVLKPGGWAILQVPFFNPVPEKTFEDPTIVKPAEREKAFGQDDHVRMYGQDYPERLRKAGFVVTEDHFVQDLDRGIIERHGLPADETIYFCQKPQ
jgi:SAM-dependent methyltransferase